MLLLRNTGNASLRGVLSSSPIFLHFYDCRAPNSVGRSILTFKRLLSLEIEVPEVLKVPVYKDWRLGNEFIHQLPQTLQILYLPFTNFTLMDIDALPRSITKLEIHSNNEWGETVANLPRSLKFLRTKSSFANFAIQYLPPDLESLDSYTTWTDDNIPLLPRGLKALALRSAFTVSDIGILQLPQSLTSLILNKCSISTEGFAALPKTLISLDISACWKLDASIFASLPPQLVHLVPPPGAIALIVDDHVAHLPKSLRGFNLTAASNLTANSVDLFSDHFFAQSNCMMPAALQLKAVPRHLKMHRSPSLMTSSWMRPYLADSAFREYLPPHLTHLRLEGLIYAPEDYFDNLPPNLTKLELPNLRNLIDSDLRKLPRNLNYLSAYMSESLSDEGLACLPPTLTVLMLAAATHPSDHGLASLPRSLTILGLPKAKNVSSVGIKYLPPSLTYLDLSHANGINTDAIKALPPNLRTLHLSECTELTDEDIQLLPRSLTLVDLSNSRKLTSECSASFPANIKVHLPFQRTLFGQW